MNIEPIATGTVASACVNGISFETVLFERDGPVGDDHKGFERSLSGHDGTYMHTSALQKGHTVLNWRSWTGLSVEEMQAVSKVLGAGIPVGCLLENVRFSGIPDFSQLAPTSRLVFPKKTSKGWFSQAVLAVWEQNGPCKTVGQRLADHYGQPDLVRAFIAAAQGKRGVTGMVLSAGWISVGDAVMVYPPVRD